MTHVRYKHEDDKYELICEGHATGSEKVCAAVSGIVYALEGWVVNNETDVEEHECEMRPGYFRLKFRSGRPESEAVFDMALIGLMNIEAGNAEYIDVDVIGYLRSEPREL